MTSDDGNDEVQAKTASRSLIQLSFLLPIYFVIRPSGFVISPAD
jgi:hypothetical protein